MPTKNLDHIMEGAGSIVRFHNEVFNDNLSYGRRSEVFEQVNIKDELEEHYGGVRSNFFNFWEGSSINTFGFYGNWETGRMGLRATEIEVSRHSGPYKRTQFVHQSLNDLFNIKGDFNRDVQEQLINEHEIDLSRDLPLFVNSHRPAHWNIETGMAEPVIEEHPGYGIKVIKFVGIPVRTKRNPYNRIITGVNRQYDTETKPAYSDEIINTQTREPLYVNEVGFYLPSIGKTTGAMKSRFLLFQLYTTESVDQMTQNVGGNLEQKDLLLNLFEKNFPNVYQASQMRLSTVETSLEQLPAFQYTPNTIEISKI